MISIYLSINLYITISKQEIAQLITFINIYQNSDSITAILIMDSFHNKKLSQQKQQSHHDLAIHDTGQKKLRAIKSQTCLSHSKINQLYNDSHINDRFAQLRILTKQKDQLMSQLHSLKEGAVTALLQKEQIIDRLKNQHKYQVYFEDEKEQMQKQLNKYMRRIKQLIQQRNEITQKYEKQRIFFFDELYNKQAIIDQLSSRIASLHVENDDLSDQNKKINAQLIQSQQNVQLMKQQIQQMKSQLLDLYKRAQNKQKKQVSFNVKPIEYCPGCQQKMQDKNHNSNQNSRDLLQELKMQYEIQIEELRNFYEQQLSIMKAICDKQILDPGYLKKTLQTQGFSDQQQNQSVLDLFSIKSGLKSKTMSNLRNQLKAIKSFKANDEDQSQFTNKYFTYQNKPLLVEKDSLQSTKTIHVQQQNKLHKQQKSGFATKRQVIALLGGGVLGAITWAGIIKLFSK